MDQSFQENGVAVITKDETKKAAQLIDVEQVF